MVGVTTAAAAASAAAAAAAAFAIVVAGVCSTRRRRACANDVEVPKSVHHCKGLVVHVEPEECVVLVQTVGQSTEGLKVPHAMHRENRNQTPKEQRNAMQCNAAQRNAAQRDATQHSATQRSRCAVRGRTPSRGNVSAASCKRVYCGALSVVWFRPRPDCHAGGLNTR